MNNSITSKALRAYIDSKDITLYELSQLTGVSYNVIKNVFNGRTALKADDFLKICNALGATTDEVLTFPINDEK